MYSSEEQVSENSDSHRRIDTGFFESFSTKITGGHKPYLPLRDGYDGWHVRFAWGRLPKLAANFTPWIFRSPLTPALVPTTTAKERHHMICAYTIVCESAIRAYSWAIVNWLKLLTDRDASSGGVSTSIIIIHHLSSSIISLFSSSSSSSTTTH